MVGERFLQDRRAITPVLSNLLLTVVAVAAMSIATTTTYVISVNLRETMSERVVVEDLWFNPEVNSINVYLRNVGKVTIHVAAVYLNHTSQSFTTSSSLGVGQHNWLNISYAWSSGNLYYIDIVTTRGSHIESYYEAP